MRYVFAALIYLSAAIGANATDLGPLEALREGEMRKLIFHETPMEVSTTPVALPSGEEAVLQDWRGKWVLLNFWATWCAPCRHEMPMLSELQSEFGGDRFEVVTVATGRNPVPAMERFFEEIGVDNLPLYRDPRQAMARDMAVLGLPITVLIDPEGREVARMRGDADWASDSAKAIIAALQIPG
ncbi:MAG: TlpA disulfide reductase family protein [Shimia sp.]